MKKVKGKRKSIRKEKEIILEFNIFIPIGKCITNERKNILSKGIASDRRATHILTSIKEDELYHRK